MATRKITPTSSSQQMAVWAGSIMSPQDAPDPENRSPSPSDSKWPQQSSNRTSSGGKILQEISNSSLRRRGKLTPKPPAISMFAGGTPDNIPKAYDGTFPEYLSSPVPPTPGSFKIKTAKTRKKVAPRRSVSGETRKYVEHLECELATAQSQLSRVNSPSVSREQTSRLRQLSADNKRLSKQLEEWEEEFEQRIQEEVERHMDLEADLRLDIRSLQDKLEDAFFRVQELETSLEAAGTNFQAVEDANVQLEKRLEILSEILATSPNKIDLHTQPRTARSKHSRPWSMLPRFPTGAPVGVSPDRCSWVRPTSPATSFHKSFGFPNESRHQGFTSSCDNTPSPEAAVNTQSILPGMTIGDTNMNELVGPMHDLEYGMPVFPMNTMTALQSPKPKQNRRMRRFHGGSTGPRPLILPSTTHCEPHLTSAPPYDRHESPPGFNIPETNTQLCTPVQGRRRASTQADHNTLARLALSPLLTSGDRPGSSFDHAHAERPSTPPSDRAPMYFSSLGSTAGRNLMDELSHLQLVEGELSYRPLSSGSDQVEAGASTHGDLTVLVQSPSTKRGSDEDDPQDYYHLDGSPFSLHSDVPPMSSKHQRDQARDATAASTSPCPATEQDDSFHQRTKQLCVDLWHRPIELARHLMQSASHTFRMPKCLRDIQWWLVGLLLGPMARHKLIAHSLQQREHCLTSSTSSPPPRSEQASSPSMQSSAPVCRKRTACHGKKCATVEQKQESQGAVTKSAHSPWLWLKFSLTLAVAVGTAFTRGPGTLLLDSEAVMVREEKVHHRRRRGLSQVAT
ncbi:hypothetical protein K431DRAFT_282962 [Polychaeton citri CBS 116435]|uniref:Uncharacterized protein n=1 Tax=Polychaeton citri CBS 116435 TaxID=1314669 RepID=A0A9P4QF25_9PEZI|nr:hypothetical protein K431DRAFT_282962 [Polychaeton citri CBS 116435]